MYCSHCGSSALDGSQYCQQCGKGLADNQLDLALEVPSRIAVSELPAPLIAGLTLVQRDCLAFAARDMTVKSALIQSFNIGSYGKGSVRMTGFGRAIGPWGIFGGLGSISQQTVNTFRTDIQVKLQDAAGHRRFLNYSLPFAFTTAIQPDETLRVFYVKGGLPNPSEPGDFTVAQWTPFAAQNLDTGQVVPITGLPTLSLPDTSRLLVPGVVIGVTGLMFFALALLGGGIPLIGLILTLISGGLIWRGLIRKKNSNQALRQAAQSVTYEF